MYLEEIIEIELFLVINDYFHYFLTLLNFLFVKIRKTRSKIIFFNSNFSNLGETCLISVKFGEFIKCNILPNFPLFLKNNQVENENYGRKLHIYKY
jgi:hypothetical protein